MARHLKTEIISGLDRIVSEYVILPANSAPRARGVRYLTFVEGIDAYFGMMNSHKEGRHYRKHIIVRRCPEHNGLHQLYTYHFPTHWSAACVANRELIKEAQRQAHALERDHSMEALEWRIRFLNHYFNVFKAHKQPEPGLKPYARFYQYTYVSIYRALQSARDAAKSQETQTISNDIKQYQTISNDLKQPQTTSDDVTFEPIPLHRLHTFARRRQAFSRVFLGAMTPLQV